MNQPITLTLSTEVFSPLTLKAIYRHANNIASWYGTTDLTPYATIMNTIRCALHSHDHQSLSFDLLMCSPDTIKMISSDVCNWDVRLVEEAQEERYWGLEEWNTHSKLTNTCDMAHQQVKAAWEMLHPLRFV